MTKRNLLLLLIFVSLLGCESNPQKNVHLFDMPEDTNYLKGNIKESGVAILNSKGMVACDDYLIIFDDVQKDLFKVYKLPGLNYLYSWGSKGKGPEEFLNIDDSSIRGYKNQLELMDSHYIKRFEILNNKMIMTDKIELTTLEKPINGIQRISDSIYFADNLISDPNHEHVMLNLNTKEISKKFGTYPDMGPHTSRAHENFIMYNKLVASNPILAKFAAFYNYFGLIKIYDKTGQLEKKIILNDPEIEMFSTNQNVENKTYFALPYATENYVTIYRVNKTDSEIGNDIDNFKPELLIWNWDGEFIARCSLDMPITRYAISEKYKTLYGAFPLKEDEIYHFDLSEVMDSDNNTLLINKN